MAASRKFKNKKTLVESSYKDQMCSACLCATRPTHTLDDVLFKCYMGILLGSQLVRHVRLSNNPHLCWECRSVLTRWIHFRKQVKESFGVLHSARKQKVLSSKMKHPGRLESRFLFSINIVPGECNDVSTVMTAWRNDVDDSTLMTACKNDDDDSKEMTAGVDDEDGLTVMISGVDDDDESKVMAACSDEDDSTVMTACGDDDDDSTVMTACRKDDDDLMMTTAAVDEHDYCELLLAPVKEEDECESENPTGKLIVDNMQTTVFIEPFEPVDDEDDNDDVETSSKTSSKITYEEKLPFPRKECAVLFCSDQQCKKCPIGKKLCIIDTADKQVKLSKLLFHNGGRPHKCKLCPKTFRTLRQLSGHTWTDHGVEHLKSGLGFRKKPELECQCDFCWNSFSNKRNRASHMRRYHPNIQYECDDCHKHFTNKLHLRNHMYIHRKCICALCSKVFRNDKLLKKHLRTHEKFICPLCYKVFQSFKMFCTHLKTHPGELFECDKCHKKFNVKTDLKRHMINHSKNYLCEICSNAFVNHRDLRIHMKIHNGENPYKCKLCPNTFKTSLQLLRHKWTAHGMEIHRCQVCPRTFVNIESLNKHAERHANHNTKINTTCELCNRTFPSVGRYLRHHREHIGESVKGIECLICNKSVHKSSLKWHMLTHNPVYNWKCEVCHKLFMYKHYLKTHRLSAHSDTRPFQCDKCTKAYKLKGDLNRHLLTHDAVKLYQCNECLKTFSRRQYLRIHMRTHFGKKTQCDVCLKWFKGSYFEIHKRIHTGERPFQCVVCNKTFYTQKHLKQHKVVHTRERPFQCNVCSNTYARKDYLLVHMRSHTGNTAH